MDAQRWGGEHKASPPSTKSVSRGVEENKSWACSGNFTGPIWLECKEQNYK